MAIIKHIPVKNRSYTAAVQYLSCQYDERTNQPLLDEKARYIEREDYRIEGYNCDVDNFGADCIDVNRGFGKNNSPKDVKAHHYIISFAPEDDITLDGAMAFGKRWVSIFAPGHQAVIAVHPDGHNGSGNVHVHIVFNSVRKYKQRVEPWHEKPCESKEGCKHRSTGRMMRAAKQWVMEQCRKLGLRQVDLLTPKHEDYYRVRERLDEKERVTGVKQLSDKDKIRLTLDELVPEFTNIDDLIEHLRGALGWKVRRTQRTISYQMPEMSRPVRGKRLGSEYDVIGMTMRFFKAKVEREQEEARQAEKDLAERVAQHKAERGAAGKTEQDTEIIPVRDVTGETTRDVEDYKGIKTLTREKTVSEETGKDVWKKTEPDVAERAVREKVNQDAAEKAEQERKERELNERYARFKNRQRSSVNVGTGEVAATDRGNGTESEGIRSNEDGEFEAFLAEQKATRASAGRRGRDSESNRQKREAERTDRENERQRQGVETGREDKKRSRGAKVR